MTNDRPHCRKRGAVYCCVVFNVWKFARRDVMNCKPGDLAVIVKSRYAPELIGRIVGVLYAAPVGADFMLPCGTIHDALTPRLGFRWVCEFQNPIAAPSTFGPIETIYSPVPDDFLRPIRDNDGDDEMLRIAGLPNKRPEVVL